MTKVTQSTKPLSSKNTARVWHLIDLDGQILGRAAQAIATLLQGKGKVEYAPYLDTGDYVVVINAKKVEVTGKKPDQKTYTSFSGYPGGLTETTYKEMMIKKPNEIIRHAVFGMLPKNKLRDRRIARLYIFTEDKHPYQDRVTPVKTEKIT